MEHSARLSSCRSRKHVASAVAGHIRTYTVRICDIIFFIYFREPASALQTDNKGKSNIKNQPFRLVGLEHHYESKTRQLLLLSNYIIPFKNALDIGK